MAYQALYRKWRPLIFDQVVGQEHITKTLKNEVKSSRVGHAYLFCGLRGTGKTSTARILSRAINCQNPQDGNPCNECEHCKGILDGSIFDITEIDAASNTGVDSIRDLRDEARFGGSHLNTKVYIIDEVHMLSQSAFNALLKILEEPPEHVRFILATTEAHKVPATILSRCQRFDFKRITTSDIEKQLTSIMQAEGAKPDARSIRVIAEKGDGSMRDALSILDQCRAIGDGNLPYDDISVFLGVTDTEVLSYLACAIAEKDSEKAMQVITDYVDSGKNIPSFVEDFAAYVRNLLLCKFTSDAAKMLDMVQEEAEKFVSVSKLFSQEQLINIIRLVSETAAAAKFSFNARVLFEIAVIKMINPIFDADPSALAARIGELELAVKRGVAPAPAKAQKSAEKPAPEFKKEASKVQKEEVKSSGTLDAIKRKWADIKTSLLTENHLQVAFALENAILSEENERLCLEYADHNEFVTCRELLDADNLKLLKDAIFRACEIETDIIISEKKAESYNDRLKSLEAF